MKFHRAYRQTKNISPQVKTRTQNQTSMPLVLRKRAHRSDAISVNLNGCTLRFGQDLFLASTVRWCFRWMLGLQDRIQLAEGEQAHRPCQLRSIPQAVNPEMVCSSGERHPTTHHTPLRSWPSRQPSPLHRSHCSAPLPFWPCLLRLKPRMVAGAPIASPTASSDVSAAPMSPPGSATG